MARRKVSGWTQERIDEHREKYAGDEPYDEHYCLAKIPQQPDDYDGPQRYCMNFSDVIDRGDAFLCKNHGGALQPMTDENRKDPHIAGITHGMNAELKNLVKAFDEKDQALYDWITQEYPEAYGINVDEDPAAAYDLHRLAAEIVRAERGRGFLIEEGEVHEKEVRGEDGGIVIDRDTGEVVTEKSEHYLAGMMHRQDKKISNLEKELGISRKERLKQDATDSAVESIKSFAEVGKTLLNREEQEYDGSEEPWKDDE